MLWLMEITFKNKKLQKIFNSEKELVAKYGRRGADRVMRRLDDLAAASSLEMLRTLPGRCHELKGDKRGVLSLDLEHPLRLLFEPSNTDIKKEDGGLDWKSVKAIKIIGIEDTHD